SNIISKYGHIHILVNVIGGYLGGKGVSELDEKEWESLSEESKESNINVNCIMPSIIDTEANRKAMPTADFSKWVKSEELANVVLFLCSEDAKVITGAAIPTYGVA